MLGIDQDKARQEQRLRNLHRNAEAVAEILSARVSAKEGESVQAAIWFEPKRLDDAFELYLARLPAYRKWVGSESLTNAAKIAALTILCILELRPLQYGKPTAAKGERLFSNAYLCLHVACNFMRVSLDAVPARLQYGFMRSILLAAAMSHNGADSDSMRNLRHRITLVVHLIELLFRKTGDVMPLE